MRLLHAIIFSGLALVGNGWVGPTNPVGVFFSGKGLSGQTKEEKQQQAFNLNVGAAIDILRDDIPCLLHKAPDLSIFSEAVRVSDPTGEKLQGKVMYSHMYKVLRGMSAVALQEASTVQARFFFDRPRSTLRAKVSAELWVHGMDTSGKPMHLDIVSLYTFNSLGLVSHHKLERVEMDGTRLESPFNVLHVPNVRSLLTDGIQPVPAIEGPHLGGPQSLEDISKQRAGGPNAAWELQLPTPLEMPQIFQMSNGGEQQFDIYGNIIPPSMQEKTGPDAAKVVKKPKMSFMDFLKKLQPESCEDDWDCPTSEHCCDYVVAKACCSGGQGIMEGSPAPALQPILARIDDGYGPQPQAPEGW